MSSLLGGFGANLNQTIGRTEQALEIIESKDFFERLYQDDVFLTELMAYDSSNSADAQIDKEIYYESQLVAIRKRYKDAFLKILPPEKVSELYKSEREFRDELIKQLSERSERAGN